MTRLVLAAALLAGCAFGATGAKAYLGENIQGRPHGGKLVIRELYRRHHMKVPYRYRHGSRSYNY